MNKTVQSVKNSLKFKAQPKSGILSVKIGVKKYSVPVEARMLANSSYVFLSFPASSELYKVTDKKELAAMKSSDDASEALVALTPSRRRSKRSRQPVELPTELEAALKNIPSGYRLGYGPDGSVKLVRTRVRRRKS